MALRTGNDVLKHRSYEPAAELERLAKNPSSAAPVGTTTPGPCSCGADKVCCQFSRVIRFYQLNGSRYPIERFLRVLRSFIILKHCKIRFRNVSLQKVASTAGKYRWVLPLRRESTVTSLSTQCSTLKLNLCLNSRHRSAHRPTALFPRSADRRRSRKIL